jgi:hypothetical protein
MSFKDLVGGLLSVAIPIFGEKVDYRPTKGGSFLIDAVFDEFFEQVDPNSEEIVASNVPMIGIKANAIPFPPEQEDEVRIGQRRFKVVDSQEDGQGGISVLMYEIE